MEQMITNYKISLMKEDIKQLNENKNKTLKKEIQSELLFNKLEEAHSKLLEFTEENKEIINSYQKFIKKNTSNRALIKLKKYLSLLNFDKEIVKYCIDKLEQFKNKPNVFSLKEENKILLKKIHKKGIKLKDKIIIQKNSNLLLEIIKKAKSLNYISDIQMFQ